MKKKAKILFAAILGIFFSVTQIFCLGCGYTNSEEKLLRIHVRADSDAPQAQTVKNEVAKAIGYYLSDELAGIDDYDGTVAALKERCDTIRRIADAVLRRNGFGYSATVTLCKESFPACLYEGRLVEAGLYDALIVRLGVGDGDNWWGIVYPQTDAPAGGGVYKSLIAEVINNRNK